MLGQPGEGGLRSIIAAIGAVLGLDRSQARSAAFSAAVVALSAKLSIADGVALKIEEDTFERVFKFADDDLDSVRRLFALAKQDVAGFETYAARISQALEAEVDLKRDVFDGLFHIATADGVLHEGEDRYLEKVSEAFGYSDQQYRALRAAFVHDSDDPYVALGVPHTTSDRDLKAHYRRLVREHHPDAVTARGAPVQAIELAQRKLAGINAAWDRVAKERNL